MRYAVGQWLISYNRVRGKAMANVYEFRSSNICWKIVREAQECDNWAVGVGEEAT